MPKSINGLSLTGRRISASHESHASLRVQGMAFAIGHASGAAAAVAAVAPRQVDGNAVQTLLVTQRANLDIERLNSLALAS